MGFISLPVCGLFKPASVACHLYVVTKPPAGTLQVWLCLWDGLAGPSAGFGNSLFCLQQDVPLCFCLGNAVVNEILF